MSVLKRPQQELILNNCTPQELKFYSVRENDMQSTLIYVREYGEKEAKLFCTLPDVNNKPLGLETLQNLATQCIEGVVLQIIADDTVYFDHPIIHQALDKQIKEQLTVLPQQLSSEIEQYRSHSRELKKLERDIAKDKINNETFKQNNLPAVDTSACEKEAETKLSELLKQEDQIVNTANRIRILNNLKQK